MSLPTALRNSNVIPLDSRKSDPLALYQPLVDVIAQAVAQEVRKALEERPPVRRRLLDAEQVGIIVGRTERSVLQAYHKGKIPGFLLMGKTVFDEADIHEWIEREKGQ
jgi:predicted DNA-binding transcriptional regulator AlpA